MMKPKAMTDAELTRVRRLCEEIEDSTKRIGATDERLREVLAELGLRLPESAGSEEVAALARAVLSSPKASRRPAK